MGWLDELDPATGVRYYLNTKTGESRWTVPDEFERIAHLDELDDGDGGEDGEDDLLAESERIARSVAPSATGKKDRIGSTRSPLDMLYSSADRTLMQSLDIPTPTKKAAKKGGD